jgi:ectoine hydroxylase
VVFIFAGLMLDLRRIFARYTGWLRNLKAVYVIHNLLHSARLLPNRARYRARGVQKSIFAPIGSRDFKPAQPHELPWLDQPNALEQLAKNADYQALSPELQAQVRQFTERGFMTLRSLIAPADIIALNAEVEARIGAGEVGFNYTGRKIFNLFEQSQLANERFFRHPELLRVLKFLLGRDVVPFQSLNFVVGSEQRAHSDLIHMTTDPPGYMIAAWIALEPVTPHNGPVVYYPGSHRLPFVSTEDYDSGNTTFTIGAHSNRRYEDHIERLISEKNLVAEPFLAEPGDVLIWHANLIHGGSRITQAGATRRSMVCHYFGADVVCYHEMSQRPAILQ